MINAIDGRIIEKISTVAGQVPTVAPSFDHTDGTWSATDIYEGEIFVNTADEKVYTRCGSSIVEITGGGVASDLETTLGVGNATGPNWIEVEDTYGIKTTVGDVTDKVVLWPSANRTGINSENSVTGEQAKVSVNSQAVNINSYDGTDLNSGINIQPSYVTLEAAQTSISNNASQTITANDITLSAYDDASQIIDSIFIDPQGLGNGTGVRSEDSISGNFGAIVVNPVFTVIANNNASGGGGIYNLSTLNLQPNLINLQTTDGVSQIDTISLDPLGSIYGTGISSENTSTGEQSKLFIKPTDTTISVTDGGNITDTISIDPQGLGNGTGIISQDFLTGRNSGFGVSPDGISTNLAGASTGVIGGTVITSNTTPTVITSFIPAIRKVYQVEAIVRGIKTNWAQAATFKINASFRVNALGVVTEFGTQFVVENNEFTTATAVLSTDGTKILVKITGEAATTINWSSTLTSNIG